MKGRDSSPESGALEANRVRRELTSSVGRPLDIDVRARMESRLRPPPAAEDGFGYRALEAAADSAAAGPRRPGASSPEAFAPADFTTVRLHTDGHAASAARR